MAALRFSLSHADPALSTVLAGEGHTVRVSGLPSRTDTVIWNGAPRIAAAWRRRGLGVVGGNSLDTLSTDPRGTALFMADRGLWPAHSAGVPVECLIWCNGNVIVKPDVVVIRDADATLLIPTVDPFITQVTAAFQDALLATGHVGGFSISSSVVAPGLADGLTVRSKMGPGVLAAWLSLCTESTAGEQLAEFAAGHLDAWELRPDWPMALLAHGRIVTGHNLTFMRAEIGDNLALQSAEAQLAALHTLGWHVVVDEAQQLMQRMTAPGTGMAPGADRGAPTGEHTQTGGFESPTHAVNPSPEAPMSAGGSSSPSPSN